MGQAKNMAMSPEKYLAALVYNGSAIFKITNEVVIDIYYDGIYMVLLRVESKI